MVFCIAGREKNQEVELDKLEDEVQEGKASPIGL